MLQFAISNKTSKSTAKAFTLIELLVVIAIIAILAAILFPVFGRARENARKSSCQSNLKQNGLGFLQYTQDYDEKFPGNARLYQPTLNGVTSFASWNVVLHPYTKSMQIATCPSDSTSVEFDLGAPYGRAKRSYSYAEYLQTGVSSGAQQGLNQSAVPAPALTVMLGEVHDDLPTATSGLGSYNQNAAVDTTAKFASSAGQYLGERPGTDGIHLATCNVLYADGHVKAQKFSAGGQPLLTGHTTTLVNGGTTGTHIGYSGTSPAASSTLPTG